MSFENERRHLQEQAARVREWLTEFLDESDRFLERAECADMTQRDAVLKHLQGHRGKAFRARDIQLALEAEGMAFGSDHSASVTLGTLNKERRVRQIDHGLWTIR